MKEVVRFLNIALLFLFVHEIASTNTCYSASSDNEDDPIVKAFQR